MISSFAASELLWEEQQRADRARTKVERRAWLKRFALVFGLIVLALAVATGFAAFGAGMSAFL